MTVRVANEIREAGTPIYCCACFQQNPELRHIDFDAATDRGYGDGIATTVAMDDLILCANCVEEGARLLGMVREDEQKIAELEHKHELERKAREQAQRYSDTLEDALGNRPEKIHIDHRKKPRKQIEVAA